MISEYQYSSDFAKVLQNFIDLGEFGYIRDALHSPNNFIHIQNMSFDDRYDLIQQIILRKPIMKRDDVKSQSYDDPIAFLLMTIPYEPIFETELDDALSIASILQEHEWDKNITDETKMSICNAIKDIYLEMYGDNTHVSIGNIWPKNNAPKDALDYMQRLHAVFCPTSTDRLKKELHCETNLDLSAKTSIAFMKAVVEKSHILDLIIITLHEIRHFSQIKNKTPQVKKQDVDSVSHLVSSRAHNAYYALMAERQANVFMGRVEDLVKGTKIRSEIEITSDMLSSQQHGKLPKALSKAILRYNELDRNSHSLTLKNKPKVLIAV